MSQGSIHIAEVCKRLYRFYKAEQDRLDKMSTDERQATADKAVEKPDLLGGVAKWWSVKTGMKTEDVLEYIHRAGNGCCWGEWDRVGHGEVLPDISPVAEKMSECDSRGLTAEVVDWIRQEYPAEAEAAGLPRPESVAKHWSREAPAAPPLTSNAAVYKSFAQRVWCFIKELWVLTVEGITNSLTKQN